MPIKLISGIIVEKGILSISKWMVKVNESDQAPTCYKYGNNIDFSLSIYTYKRVIC